jgi:ZIP family zinc transporter
VGFAETVLLGAIAGSTIYIGLPFGRIERVDDRLRVALAMFSVGILAFIFMDVASSAQGIVSGALASFKHHHTGFGTVLGRFLILAAGFTLGAAGISFCERQVRRRAALSRGAVAAGGSTEGVLAPALDPGEARSRALQTGMTIAGAIGLHNLAEGLAIGVSARAGAISLATVLIVGFSVHNATEGFGIVGPLGSTRPSWRWLAVAGLVGGGPTFLGTIIGYQVNSAPLELAFYALAGGAILYVIGEIWTGMRRYGHRTLGLYLLAAGFILGVATDLIVSYGGG